MNNKTIEQKIQRTEKEITRLEHQKKIKQHEAKQLERNRRNRRIFTRGGMLERFMQRPLLLTDDQVYQLLQTAFNTEAVQTMEKALKLLPLGTSDFENLRHRDQIYVDKTDMICELASVPGKFFFARPRRFGKSLLLSTFESLFRDGLKNFQGLKIEQLWTDKSTYKVIKLDFSRVKPEGTFEQAQRAILIKKSNRTLINF